MARQDPPHAATHKPAKPVQDISSNAVFIRTLLIEPDDFIQTALQAHHGWRDTIA